MQRRLADVPACGDAGQPGFTNRGSRELLGLIPGGKAGKKIGKVLSKADDVADEAGSVQKARNVGGAAMLRVLSESEVELESFHDCHVHGLRWRRDQFIFSLDLQYILEWIKSSEASSGAYRFLVSEARLVFRGASELKISMDWTRSALDSEIAGVRVLGSRTTPNGLVERCFEIEFADPDGTISVWSTGYEVVLLQEPVVSEVPNIPLPDGP